MATQPTTSTQDLHEILLDLQRLASTDDADRIEQLRLLEQIKCAAASAQAWVTTELVASQRAEQERAGMPADQIGRGIAAQVALARRDSPAKGARHVGVARALLEMPHTAAAFHRGEVSEWRVTLVVRETTCLSRSDRGIVDQEIARRPGGLAALGDRATEGECRRIAYRLDPHAFTRRAARATADRCVTLRPAPDTMTYLTGLLPVTQGVAVFAALTKHADSMRSSGDERGRGQIMADTLVERVTGLATAAAVPVEINLVMTDAALFDDDPTPAQVEGYGPVPAPLVRRLLAASDRQRAGEHPGDSEGEGTGERDGTPDGQREREVWIRRLFTRPTDGELVAMESQRRVFDGPLRRFLVLRDQTCRTPWCDAPIRHADHPVRHADAGRTSALNGQGLCEACNYTKEATGWRTTVTTAGTVETTTPTGHRYRSPMPRHPLRPSRAAPTRAEIVCSRLLLTA